jgi:hypothetical protein
MEITYYEPATGMTLVPLALERRGLPADNAVLALAGIYQLDHNIPAYDADLCTLEPDGKPHPKADNPAVYVQDFVATPRDLSTAKAAVKARITARRWEAETGGVTVDGFGRILTGIDDQNRIASALQGTASAGIAEVDFKGADGWIKLSREMLANVAGIIAGHVQACFSQERTLHEAVDAAQNVDALAALDIESSWPGGAA